MPRITTRALASTRDVEAVRAVCNGCDGPRLCEEHARGWRVWLATAGCFELRDAAGRHVVDPATLFVLAADQAFTIRHPRGPDTVIAFGGGVAAAIAERGAGPRRPAARAHAGLLAEVAALRRGEGDTFALSELLLAAAEPEERTVSASRRDRALADELAYHLRMTIGESVGLGALAARAGVSMCHASRVFRRATGTGLHALRRELMLRHALALLVDTQQPIARIAADLGFASQSHLTNRFRERFATTPARLRQV